ncbi:hypothetical protein GGR56DRAFT_678217 [Xylariaceae sp. FL0804]|nr:hypothetical protein GGR56DRAFT_678217 [Xylariaceae sp. FL0804]
MASPEQVETLREQVTQAIVDQLSRANFDWSFFEGLADPVLCIEARFQDRSARNTRRPKTKSSSLAVSQIVDLTGVVSPKSGTPCDTSSLKAPSGPHDGGSSSGTIVPSPHGATGQQLEGDPGGTPTGAGDSDSEESADSEDECNVSRKAISSLRPSRADVPVVEDNTQRQMEITGTHFPKRRKAESVGYALKPSTLDKLIVGIWEQIHGGITIDPQELLGQFVPAPLLQQGTTAAAAAAAAAVDYDGDGGNGSTTTITTSSTPNTLGTGLVAPAEAGSVFRAGQPFSATNLFCRRVTQASRTCRSIEVIVQARWVEHFDAHVARLRAAAAAAHGSGARVSSSDTRHRRAALAEACGDFGWAEKELRNKMAVWRGYREIKEAGGWAALVFAGMGLYRFCKYRVGFDPDSLQRLRRLRPALEVAADTAHPRWRDLLALVGQPAERLYRGHPHDWVVFPFDGASRAPVPLRATYLQWDPYFSFRHIDECVVDEQAWGGDDPRWSPPATSSSLSAADPAAAAAATTLARVSFSSSSLPLCETCGAGQSDEPSLNACYCFPSLFGCARVAPSPVQVFRTANGRSNGLMALCAFERGAAVGEFVGLVTRGLQDVDVMEGSSSSSGGGGGGGAKQYHWQIWQGREGNFTKFVNHSCRANAQYQRFAWLGTQRVVLVSKGIAAGAEITVDYSDKYWRGLDKECLCGERACRYRRRK